MISVSDINSILSYKTCINIIRKVMVETTNRNVHLPLRQGMRLNDDDKILGYMFGYLGEPKCFGVKLVSLFKNNNEKYTDNGHRM